MSIKEKDYNLECGLDFCKNVVIFRTTSRSSWVMEVLSPNEKLVSELHEIFTLSGNATYMLARLITLGFRLELKEDHLVILSLPYAQGK